MKITNVFLLKILMILCLSSCEYDDKGLVGYYNDSELEEGDEIPFILDANYPNPFNPLTIISFSVGQPLHLVLKVYSDDWQEISKLVDSTFESGRYAEYFNANNFEDDELSSGSYFYTMEGGGYLLIRKMTLLK